MLKKGLIKISRYFLITKRFSFNDSDVIEQANEYEELLDNYDKRLHDYMINLVRNNELSKKRFQ